MIFTKDKTLHWGHYVWKFLIYPRGLSIMCYDLELGPLCNNFFRFHFSRLYLWSYLLIWDVCVRIYKWLIWELCYVCLDIYRLFEYMYVGIHTYIYSHTYTLIRALWCGLSSSQINQTDGFFPWIVVLYWNLQNTLQTGWKESRNSAFIFLLLLLLFWLSHKIIIIYLFLNIVKKLPSLFLVSCWGEKCTSWWKLTFN
jgi:hypothetical protein